MPMYHESFRQMLDTLQHRVEDARRSGMSMDEMVQLTSQIGDWLAVDAQPRTQEQRLLRDLWQVAGPQDKETLSRLLIQLAESRPQ